MGELPDYKMREEMYALGDKTRECEDMRKLRNEWRKTAADRLMNLHRIADIVGSPRENPSTVDAVYAMMNERDRLKRDVQELNAARAYDRAEGAGLDPAMRIDGLPRWAQKIVDMLGVKDGESIVDAVAAVKSRANARDKSNERTAHMIQQADCFHPSLHNGRCVECDRGFAPPPRTAENLRNKFNDVPNFGTSPEVGLHSGVANLPDYKHGVQVFCQEDD